MQIRAELQVLDQSEKPTGLTARTAENINSAMEDYSIVKAEDQD